MKFSTSLLVASILVAQVAAMPSLDLRQAGKAVANTGKGKADNNAAGTAGATDKGTAAKNGAKGGAAKGGKGGKADKGGKDAAAAKGKGGKDAAAAKGKDAKGKEDAAAAKAAKGGKGGDLQTSLTLDPSVIAKGFANDGQDVPAAGQVASLTSTNNFINFCATVPNLPITNGKQIETGSCNPAPIGTIPSSDNMPSCKFTNPPNNGNIAADKPFTISMAIKNLETGNFVNAQQNYFAAPQQVNQQGQIIGHSHVVVEQLTSIDQITPTNPKKFAFFKGLNEAAKGGVLTADVVKGLPAGAYRLSSINAAANHQPAIVPIAQHGSLDDAVYFTVGDAAAADAAKTGGGKGAAGDAKGAANANGAAAKGGKDAKNAAAGKGAAKGGKAAKDAGGKRAAKGGKAAKDAGGKAGKQAAGKGGKAAKDAGGKGGKAGKQAAGKVCL
jgi:hypothetical protein